MKKIIIYTKTNCPYCYRAKSLIRLKGGDFQEISIDDNMDLYNEMISRSDGRTTVPQIFIDGYHIGGCDDLYALDTDSDLELIFR